MSNMETPDIVKQVQKMRPSCFSVEEQCCYTAEKMMLRQFMLMQQEGLVPVCLSAKDMKTWLLRGRSFLEELQEKFEIERIRERDLFMAELAWTTARLSCLDQMEEELLQELDREEQLSQLFSRKVTLEGLQMFVSVVRPAAEEEVQTILPTLHRNLLRIIRGIQLPRGSLSEADTKPAELLELEQKTASLVPEVVDIALKFLLEEPELKDKRELASAKIAKLLTDSVVPYLSHFGSVRRIAVLSLCTLAARSIVNAIFEGFTNCSKSFHLMDYDESYLSARYGAISAIQDMVNNICLQPCTSEGQEEELHQEREDSPQVLEKEEASPGVPRDEELAMVQTHVTEASSSVSLQTNVAVSAIDEIQVLQQDEDTQKSLVQQKDVKKKKGVRAFFRGVWKTMTRCFSPSTED